MKSNLMKKTNTDKVAIEIKDLVIDYGESIAANHINLQVKEGELITLLGPSGCGKSTTLNALAGLITPTSGDIFFHGRNVTKLSPKERKVGLVFQSYALYPHMTVYKNISFPLEASNDFKNEIKQHNADIDFEIKKYAYEKLGNTDVKELVEIIEGYKSKLIELNETLERIPFEAKNEISNEKTKISQTKVRRDARVKSASKSTLDKIESNESKAIELRKEIANIGLIEKDENKRDALVSEIQNLIEETKIANAKLYSDYSEKIKLIDEEFQRSKVEVSENSNKRIAEIKESTKIELAKAKNEKNNFINANNDSYKNAILKINSAVKNFNPSEEDESAIKAMKSKKLLFKAEVDRKVREVAERVGITSQLNKKVTKLSGGQQQRVAISRTLVKNPNILLLDEPLSNLDAKMRVSTREWIRNLQQELGITTVFVTHDQEEAMSISDKVVCMSDGYIQQVEEPMEMYHNPVNKHVAGFLGMPQMTFFEKESEIAKQLNEKFSLKDKTFGVRPEHVKVKSEVQTGTKTMIDFKVKVTLVESFGRERLITGLIGNEKIRFFTELQEIKVNDEVDISIRKGKLYVFDNDKSETVVDKL